MKEKATELVNKFYFNDKLQISYEEAILCALICVNEKIKMLRLLYIKFNFDGNAEAGNDIEIEIMNEEEVKQEINNL